jgi:nucleotide-binding universal stress UspA family protein
MYNHILIPIDGSELSRMAINHGIALAKSVNSKVTAMTVTVPFHVFSIEPGMGANTPERYEKNAADMAAKDLGVAKDAAKANGISCDTIRVDHESPYRAIIDTAAQKACDLIVMAWHGRRGISTISHTSCLSSSTQVCVTCFPIGRASNAERTRCRLGTT